MCPVKRHVVTHVAELYLEIRKGKGFGGEMLNAI